MSSLSRFWEALKLLIEGLGKGAIEVSNEVKNLLPQVLSRSELTTLEQTTDEDAEPALNLIQPG